jgi:hypothetical protein
MLRMVAQQVQIHSEQLEFMGSLTTFSLALLKRNRINSLILLMRRMSIPAALLCEVKYCRTTIYEGFQTTTSHNEELHITRVTLSCGKKATGLVTGRIRFGAATGNCPTCRAFAWNENSSPS